jgi:hypothetical protein
MHPGAGRFSLFVSSGAFDAGQASTLALSHDFMTSRPGAIRRVGQRVRSVIIAEEPLEFLYEAFPEIGDRLHVPQLCASSRSPIAACLYLPSP